MVQDWKFKAKLINKGKKTKPVSKSIYAKSPAQDQQNKSAEATVHEW